MILTIGELLIDIITTDMVPDLSEAKLLQAKTAGSCGNFALFCKKQNAQVCLVASVGLDGFGQMAIKTLDDAGIDTTYIQQHEDYVTSIIIVGKSHATPEFIPYRFADYHINPIPFALIEKSTLLHSTAFGLSMQPAQQNILKAFLQAAEEGKIISIDWNYAPKIWNDKKNAMVVFENIIALKPLLKVSLDDVERFWGISNTIEKAKEVLQNYHTSVTCLTCGAEGVWYREGHGGWHFKETLPANVIDVTGAGDAFWSGFICSYVQNNDINSCVDNALYIAKQRVEQKI